MQSEDEIDQEDLSLNRDHFATDIVFAVVGVQIGRLYLEASE